MPPRGTMPEDARVAVLMTCFRQEPYVEAALAAALAQSWPALDVVVADDGSDDGTWDVVAAVAGRYRGPHRLVLHRQPRNVGPARNLMDALRCTDADFLVLTHGDDLSSPNRVQRVAETWLATGASLISHQAVAGPDPARATPLAEAPTPSGFVPLGELCRHTWTPQMLGASFSFERRVFTEFGAIDRARLPRGGDHVLPTRAALLGGFYHLAEPLMFWRRHDQQMTRAIADFEGTPASHLETWRMYDLNALLYRLDELRGFASRHGRSDALAKAEATLLATIAQYTGEWAAARASLEAAGHTLTFERPARRRAEGVAA